MLDLNSDDKGTWFYFDPDNQKAGGVCLRELTTEENLRIEKLTVTKKRKFKRGAWLEDKTTNEVLASKLRFDFCIVDWKEVSIDGQKVECTKDNKVRAMKIINFVKIILESLEELTENNKALKEARVKNLPPASSGKTGRSTVPPA